MKKYVKPKILFERFEISQQIAACDYDSNNTSADENCKFTGEDKDWGTITIFRNGCGNETDGSFWVESYCYHNSIASEYGIFNS